MNALEILPAGYRSVPSLQSVAQKFAVTKQQNNSLRGELNERKANSLPTMEAAGAAMFGAGLCGVALAKGASETMVGVGGAVAIAVGIMAGQPTLVHTGIGFVAPVIATMAGRAASGNASWGLGELVKHEANEGIRRAA